MRPFLPNCNRTEVLTMTTTSSTLKPKKESFLESLQFAIIWVVVNAFIFFPLLIFVTIVWSKRGKSKCNPFIHYYNKPLISNYYSFFSLNKDNRFLRVRRFSRRHKPTDRSGVNPNAGQSKAGSAVNPSVSLSKAV